MKASAETRLHAIHKRNNGYAEYLGKRNAQDTENAIENASGQQRNPKQGGNSAMGTENSSGAEYYHLRKQTLQKIRTR